MSPSGRESQWPRRFPAVATVLALPYDAGPSMTSRVIPTVRYRDAAVMADWLCTVFGFTKQLVVPGEDGAIVHAQLTLGTGMIMLGTHQDDAFGALMDPAEPATPVTQSAYLIVDDPDAVYARARDNSAVIVMEIKDEDYGGRGFSCRDPEGQVWNVGSYDPW